MFENRPSIHVERLTSFVDERAKEYGEKSLPDGIGFSLLLVCYFC